MLKLVLAFEDSGAKRMLSVATVQDEDLLRRAARLAVAQADQEASEVARESPTMGQIRQAEAVRLRTVLRSLLPGFDSALATATNGTHQKFM